jgi:hypothetical protein
VDPQGQQPTDAQPVDQADAAASDAPQEAESSFFNSMIRGLAGVFGRGRDDEPSEPAAEQESATAPTADQAAQQPQAQPSYTQADFDRAVQSRSDQLLARQQRDWARSRADEGDLTPIRTLAEKGDPWAQRQLADNGDTWALGEIKQRELREAQQRENDPLPILATSFDQAILHPILGALPREDEEKIVGQGLVGLDGRQQAVTQAIAALKRHAADEALVKALDDPAYLRQAVQSETFRTGVLSHPVRGQQLLARHRGEVVEPDLNPGSGPGRGGTRENDVMNQLIRGLAQGAEARAPRERAAGAGARSGRAVNLDALDDDE